MKHSKYQPYVAVGVTAFCVIAGAILFFFLLFHAGDVYALVRMVGHILRPIFMGIVLAFLLLPIHRHILRFLTAITPDIALSGARKQRFLNMLAIILSMLFAVLLIYILLAMVLPQVYLSVVGLVNAVPDYIESVQTWLQKFLEDNPGVEEAILSYYTSAADSLEAWLRTDILPNLESVSSSIFWIKESVLPNVTGVVSNVSALVIELLVLMKDILIAIIVTVYLLARKDVFSAQSKKIVYSIFKTRHADFIVEEVRGAYRILSGFINGKLLDSLIIGIIALVFCNILRFPYPALLATIIGVTNVIPFFGPFIGAIPCALLILLVSPLQCLYFVIFILILQQFDGNILGPKILGDSTGLASFWVLFSILLFGGLFGFAGMVLGVPVFAMLYNAIRRLVNRGLRRRNLPTQTEFYFGQTPNLSDRQGEEQRRA